MTFTEIERIIGAKLPPVAHRYRAWWSNNETNSVMTKVWLEAGFRSERVDMKGRRLVFRRISPIRPRAHGSLSETVRGAGSGEKRTSRRHPMFGALKGTFSIESGTDLAAPAMPEWADLIDEKYGKGPAG